MIDPFDLRIINSWLTTQLVSAPEFEHQDADAVIAANVRCFDLLPLLDQPNCIPSRRDLLIYAMMEQLAWLDEPDNPMDEVYTEKEAMMAKQELLRFARVHWSEIKRIDTEIGFAADDYKTLMALVLADRLHGR